jgi:hypothetical protein
VKCRGRRNGLVAAYNTQQWCFVALPMIQKKAAGELRGLFIVLFNTKGVQSTSGLGLSFLMLSIAV